MDINILFVVTIFWLLSLLIVFFFIKQKYEKDIKSLSLYNNKLEDEKNFLKENYELKLSNQAKLYEQKELNFNEKITLLIESKQQMKIEFENLATRIFEDNQKKSNINLNQVLTSFKDQLNSFGKRVNEIYNDETKQRISLLTEIKNLKDLNNQIATDAVNLTKALKGQNKTQGDWGEMILSSILEQTGLREGKEYTVQGSRKKVVSTAAIIVITNGSSILSMAQLTLFTVSHNTLFQLRCL